MILVLLPSRDLTQMRSDVTRTSRNTQSACQNLQSASQGSETGAVMALEREKGEKMQLESQMREKLKDMLDMQAKFDAEKGDLTTRWVPARKVV